MIADGNGVTIWVDKNVLNLTVVIVTQFCKYTKNKWIVHFQWVNCMVCSLYLNKAVSFKGPDYVNTKGSMKQWTDQRNEKYVAGLSTTITIVNSVQGRPLSQEIKARWKDLTFLTQIKEVPKTLVSFKSILHHLDISISQQKPVQFEQENSSLHTHYRLFSILYTICY